MSEAFMLDVMSRQWRGNVRELRSYLEQAVVLSDGGVVDTPIAHNPQQGAMDGTPQEAERSHIRKALKRCKGSVSKTAELLGISRKTLWGK